MSTISRRLEWQTFHSIGSISYFPTADGTAIVTKQLQGDGTSKIIVYKPINVQETKYITEEDVKDIREELESIKKQIEEAKGGQ